MSNPFPSMQAETLVRLLQSELGYRVIRRAGTGHRRLAAPGRPGLTVAFGDGDTAGPVVVRDLLVKQVGLRPGEALQVVRGER